MINVVSSVYVRSQLPKFIQPLADEIQKACHYAFRSDEDLNRYVKGLEERVNEFRLANRGAGSAALQHTVVGNSGNISITSKGSSEPKLYVMMSYFKLQGHIMVAKSNRGLYLENFIQENEAQ